jgi:hypothetical protein
MVGNRPVVYSTYHDDVVGGQRTGTLAHDEQWKQVKSSAHGQGLCKNEQHALSAAVRGGSHFTVQLIPAHRASSGKQGLALDHRKLHN